MQEVIDLDTSSSILGPYHIIEIPRRQGTTFEITLYMVQARIYTIISTKKRQRKHQYPDPTQHPLAQRQVGRAVRRLSSATITA